jgi:hypothetical protein
MVIPNPELLLPDERLSPAREYLAQSSFIGGTYPSLLAIIRKREKVEAQLNAEMADWQRAIAGPCYVMYSVLNDTTKDRLLVYGVIPTPTGFIESDAENASKVLEANKRRLVKRLESAHQRGWLFGKWYSRTQPLGEFGVMHRSYIQRVVEESDYRAAAARHWRDANA